MPGHDRDHDTSWEVDSDEIGVQGGKQYYSRGVAL